MYYFNTGDYQDYLILQPLCNVLSTFVFNYAKVTAFKSTCSFTEKIKPLNITFAPEIIHFYQRKSIIKFDNSFLILQKLNLTYKKVPNSYTVYNLDKWSRYPSNNFAINNSFFDEIKLATNTIKSNFIYKGCAIAFDGVGKWSFGRVFARQFVIFWCWQ